MKAIYGTLNATVEGGLIVLGLPADRQEDEDVPEAAVNATPDAPAGTWSKLAQLATPSTHDFA